MSTITGDILHLQRLSTEDGPGIRTTVFFKGCPLHCEWCHNPESISPRHETQWFAVRCIHCQGCVGICPNGCLEMADQGLTIDRERCEGCGECAAECPSGALETLGRTVRAEDLIAELIKDRAYFEKSGGGVTLSGGEPTYQGDFAEALLRGLKESGIPTALDTCGSCSSRTLDQLLPWTDLVLFDLKLMDPEAHRRFTGASNTQILKNLEHVRDYMQDQDRCMGLWIRTPLIPGATSGDENLSAIGEYLTRTLDGTLTRWELCAFNNLCRDQYTRLGLKWAYASTPLIRPEELAHCEQTARACGLPAERIHATGATRVDQV